jgi:RimJ/RimL family protein N-acetyltransferase
MKSRDFFNEDDIQKKVYSQQPRLDITHQEAVVMRHERIFFEAKLNKESDDMPAWIRAVSPAPLIAEATCELRNGDECYVGHIQAHTEGQGYGSELLKYIVDFYNKRGIHKFSAYINHNNSDSKNMFSKAGFVESDRKKEGSNWSMTK